MTKDIRISLTGLGIGALLIGGIYLTGCGNKTFIDTVYTFDKAIIRLPNDEVIEGKVQNWTDYESGDQIQVKINGNVYLVHSEDIVLIQEGK